MDIRCQYCSGQIDPNMDRIGRALGNGILISVVALAFGISGGGWVALVSSAMGGSLAARWIAQAKLELAKKSKEEFGGYFKCFRCGKDASIDHVLAQIKKNWGRK